MNAKGIMNHIYWHCCLITRFARVVFLADSSFVVCINYVPNELIDLAMETFPMEDGSPIQNIVELISDNATM